MVKNKIIFIEGARNVGKTHFMNSLPVDGNFEKYKFPFVSFYNDLYTKDIKDDKLNKNSDRELFYLTFGFDLTILDLLKNGLISTNIICDRGILSDLIYGIQAKRITLEEAGKCWNYLVENYHDLFIILNIEAPQKKDKRNKDNWEIYDQSETINIHNVLCTEFEINDYIHYYTIQNSFNNRSVNEFLNFITLITTR